MSDTHGVTPGALKEALSKSTSHKWAGKPIRVQVTNLKVINEQNLAERRYRCVFSDGQNSIQGLLDSHCNTYLEANGFTKFSVISIDKFTMAKTMKRILIVSALTVEVPKAERLGHEVTPLDPYFDQNPQEDMAMAAFGAAAQGAAAAPQAAAVPPPAAPRAKPAGPSRPVNPIESLSPYQNNWTIKGRVLYKGDIRTWSNAKGEGKLFNVNFLDESDEIRATAFNEMADKYFHLLEEGKVYYVSKARIQQAKPKFSHLSHPYELSLDKDSEITECFDTADVPKINYNFARLDAIQNLEKDTVVDVIGVINTVNDVFQITAKSTGKPFSRRNVSIVDDSNFAIDVGLWNATAVDFSIPAGSVVAFKGVKVQDFGGRSLTLTHSGSIMANPDIPEAYQLKGWYDNKGVNENFKSLKVESAGAAEPLANRKTIARAEVEGLGSNEKPDFFTVKASINYIKADNFCYPACANEINTTGRGPSPCNRKVIQESDGSWRCERCNLTYPEPHYRYILSASLVDHTGQIWVTLFDDEANKLLKTSASDLIRLKEEEDNGDFTKLINSATMRELNFRVKARQDSYNGQTKIRYQVSSISELNYENECVALAKDLEGVSIN
ncbi:replication factor-a protein [Metschnikowia bicuspidata var. bicuspidata NRRL YB-4993]|uniref:Replication protein A subunit n=1 Tax=Metschnikowia bicuspidata var. bicuspidata NRRL YB-4993 TaxID=869754 RepID=A0A1A0H6M2_9ASCO|nr:replication factor-a protein [Metschnikowia bicuspidata var. bicuspidata NRRL YB-4993]OBA19610.1 replication factor-a protein [Metschnikowia bicuspidata var. bicuspidata NRRL YB-4993]